jgi:hypothetical protein
MTTDQFDENTRSAITGWEELIAPLDEILVDALADKGIPPARLALAMIAAGITALTAALGPEHAFVALRVAMRDLEAAYPEQIAEARDVLAPTGGLQ